MSKKKIKEVIPMKRPIKAGEGTLDTSEDFKVYRDKKVIYNDKKITDAEIMDIFTPEFDKAVQKL